MHTKFAMLQAKSKALRASVSTVTKNERAVKLAQLGKTNAAGAQITQAKAEQAKDDEQAQQKANTQITALAAEKQQALESAKTAALQADEHEQALARKSKRIIDDLLNQQNNQTAFSESQLRKVKDEAAAQIKQERQTSKDEMIKMAQDRAEPTAAKAHEAVQRWHEQNLKVEADAKEGARKSDARAAGAEKAKAAAHSTLVEASKHVHHSANADTVVGKNATVSNKPSTDVVEETLLE